MGIWHWNSSRHHQDALAHYPDLLRDLIGTLQQRVNENCSTPKEKGGRYFHKKIRFRLILCLPLIQNPSSLLLVLFFLSINPISYKSLALLNTNIYTNLSYILLYKLDNHSYKTALQHDPPLPLHSAFHHLIPHLHRRQPASASLRLLRQSDRPWEWKQHIPKLHHPSPDSRFSSWLRR